MAPVINGVLNIDKSPGPTSMDIVRRIKRLSRQRHVGHGGTLDPQASGVLPVCMGQANRLMQILVGSSKEYLATVRLGVVTDTYDAQGQVVSQQDPSAVTQQAVETSLNSLRGTIIRRPPCTAP